MSYIYQADIWCDCCGKQICEDIQKEGKAPADPDDECSYDSDEYPKSNAGLSDDSADGPQHCAAGADCLEPFVLNGTVYGAFLENDLTDEGREYVKELYKERPTELTQFWMDHYGLNEPETDEWDGADEEE